MDGPITVWKKQSKSRKKISESDKIYFILNTEEKLYDL